MYRNAGRAFTHEAVKPPKTKLCIRNTPWKPEGECAWGSKVYIFQKSSRESLEGTGVDESLY
jgi:hypothetical protein